MKQVTIIGNLGANAVRRMTSDGRELMSFNVAVNTGGDKAPMWFGCIGNMREKLMPFLVKGQCVCVTGDFSFDMYKNNVELTVNIDRVELCGARPETQDHSQQSEQVQTKTSVPVESSQQLPPEYDLCFM